MGPLPDRHHVLAPVSRAREAQKPGTDRARHESAQAGRSLSGVGWSRKDTPENPDIPGSVRHWLACLSRRPCVIYDTDKRRQPAQVDHNHGIVIVNPSTRALLSCCGRTPAGAGGGSPVEEHREAEVGQVQAVQRAVHQRLVQVQHQGLALARPRLRTASVGVAPDASRGNAWQRVQMHSGSMASGRRGCGVAHSVELGGSRASGVAEDGIHCFKDMA